MSSRENLKWCALAFKSFVGKPGAHFTTWKETHKIACYVETKIVRHWWKSPSWPNYESGWEITGPSIIGLFLLDVISGGRLQKVSKTADRYAALLKDKVISHKSTIP